MRAPIADLSLQYLIERPLRQLLPASHYFANDEKLIMEPRQACQKSKTRQTYSTSLRMAVLSFH